jgi:hypothetical protein
MNMKLKLILSVLLLTGSAMAQEQLAPTELKRKTVVTEPQTLYKGFFRSGLAFNYSTIDKFFNVDGKRESLASNAWANSWFFYAYLSYGITDRLQVDVLLPYRFNQIYQSTSWEAPGLGIGRGSKWKNTGKGLSDLSFTVAYQILPEIEKRPSFTFYLSGILPTGEKNPKNIKRDEITEIFGVKEFDPAVGSGEPSLQGEIRVRKVKYPFSYQFSGSYQYFFGGKKILNLNTPVLEERPFRSGSNLALYGTLNFHLNDWIALRNSTQYFFSVRDEYDGEKEEDNSWVVEYIPGITFQIKQFRIAQAINIPLFGKLSAGDPSFTVIMAYTF